LLHYDHARKSLAPILSRRPYLPEKTQGSRSFHRVAARDGLMLPVVVTHPAGNEAQTPLPAVVLVHGGPWVRGKTREWSHEAQFLASRGWRVLEVDFRGSQGLGWRHFHAGWKQWGLAMQDDLADAVAWAVEQKWVDAAKVCIAGSSYGGYAALMGVIRHPQMYRCAASHVGVTDLFLRYSAEGDLPSQARRFSLPTLMGHPERDAAQFRATSPVLRAAEIKVPVLLAQAIHDRRVPPSHADAFEKAARAAGVQVQRINYDEGHGWSDFNNHADYLRQLEVFIQRALGP
jgi:dipeptidyl aminopeptidase/acylaminoacyl peptidase